jgi:hypothetical protein
LKTPVEVALGVMVSGKNIPPSFEVANIKVISSIEDMGKPSASQIEDVKATSPIDVTALPDLPTSTTSSEDQDQKPYYDDPPDGGLFAWMQVLGGWILVLNSR